jgi:hypothetical protein
MGLASRNRHVRIHWRLAGAMSMLSAMAFSCHRLSQNRSCGRASDLLHQPLHVSHLAAALFE